MEWTEEVIQKLKRLRELGASPVRAALALKCNKAVVKAKARELGMPFPHLRTQRSEHRIKEEAARAKAGLPLISSASVLTGLRPDCAI